MCMNSHTARTQRGLTLIELMITLVIVAILAGIALNTYRDSVRKGHRRAAQTAMMDIVNRQQQFFVANRTYATAAQLNYTLPPELTPHYTFAIDLATPAGPPPGFTVNFTAIGAQVRDGNLSLNSRGVKTPANKW